MSERKVPKIRFPGFTDDWEQRKLGEVAKYRNGKAHENEIEDNGKYIVVNSKFVSTDGEVKKYSNVQIEPLMKDEIAFVLSDVPNGRAIARTFLVDESDKYTLNQRIAGITPLEKTYPYFLHILMNRNRYFLSFDDGAKQTNLTVADVINFEELYPSYDEQKIIGDYFNNLDNLITLHQCECNKWKELKKGMLQKMFPKEGESVPEIRFPAYEAKWSKRKLGDCANFRRGSFPQPYGKKEWYDGDNSMPFVQVADVCDNMRLADITKQRISILAQPMSVFAPEGSVLVTLQGSIGRVAITQYAAYVDRTVLIFEEYDKSINKEFWAYIIRQKFVDEAKRAPGGTIKTITKEVLSNFELYIPEYNEQKEIAILLLFIDRNIAICENELGKVLRLKKSLLQQMFVA